MRSFVLLAALVALLATGECHSRLCQRPLWLAGAPAPCISLKAPCNNMGAVSGHTNAGLACTATVFGCGCFLTPPGKLPLTVVHAAGVADAACQKGKKGCLQCKNNK